MKQAAGSEWAEEKEGCLPCMLYEPKDEADAPAIGQCQGPLADIGFRAPGCPASSAESTYEHISSRSL